MRPFMLILCALLSSSSAAKLADARYTLAAIPGETFLFQAWLTLAPEFPKDKRLVVAEFGCNVSKDGLLKFRRLNFQDYVWGDEEDEQAVTRQFLSKTGFRAGAVTASCREGRLVVQVAAPAKLSTAFPDLALDTAQLALRRSLNISPEVSFSGSTVKLMRVPFVFKSGFLTTPETDSGLALGVTQLGVLKPLANGIKTTPVKVNANLPYTLHVVAGKAYNLTVSGRQVTAWVSDKP